MVLVCVWLVNSALSVFTRRFIVPKASVDRRETEAEVRWETRAPGGHGITLAVISLRVIQYDLYQRWPGYRLHLLCDRLPSGDRLHMRVQTAARRPLTGSPDSMGDGTALGRQRPSARPLVIVSGLHLPSHSIRNISVKSARIT